METASSALEEHAEQYASVSFHRILTIGQDVQENGTTPDLLKLEVQGYELEILKGSEKALAKIRVILAEISFLDLHRGAALAAEIIQWLDRREWVT